MNDIASESELPLVCGKCYGTSEQLKIVKHVNGEECKICTRPFTVFRWQNRQQNANKTKKTIICNTCARIRNCCQSCMLDIEFGIPIDVRDTALKMAGLELPSYGSQTNNTELKQVQAAKQEAALAKGDFKSKLISKARDLLTKLAKKLREKEHLDEGEAVQQKKAIASGPTHIGDAGKLALKYPFHGTLQNNEKNGNLKGFFFFGFPVTLPQYVLSEYLKKFGKIKQLTLVHKARCGYALFVKQEAAESFALSILNNEYNSSDQIYPGLILVDGKYPMRVAKCSSVSLSGSSDIQKKLAMVAAKELHTLATKDMKRKQPQGKDCKTRTNSSGGGESESIQKHQSKKPKFNADVEL